jgi:hypothetical protein
VVKAERDVALALLRGAVERAKRKSGVGFRVAFVRDEDGNPPLAQLLRGNDAVRGGRSGDVRLKLYATLVMRATAKPYGLDGTPAYAYAQMLGVASPSGAGARRVTTALRWLHDNGFVELDNPVQGKPPELHVLHPAGEQAGSARYASYPIEMWTNGWIATLPGRAVALYLVLRELTGGSPGGWAHAEGWRKAEYGLSADTWTRATADLVNAGLLETRQRIDRTVMSQARTRMQYRLIPDGLDRDAFSGRAT